MKKYALVSIFIASLAFSYGIRPGFDFGVGWQRISWDVEYGYDLNALGFYAGTTVPYSPYVGLFAEVFGVRFWNVEDGDGNLTEIDFGGRSDIFGTFGIGGHIGLIEMIPGRSASPYFKQHFILNNYSEEGESLTSLGFGIGAGVEFLSKSNARPFLEGNFTYSSIELYESVSMTGFSFRGGVRLSWKK